MSLQVLPPKGGTHPNPFATTGKNSVRRAVARAGSYDWKRVSYLEQIHDKEELAHILLNSGLCPHDHSRIEALFRWAASGKGYHAQMLCASGMI
ncbi:MULTISPECIES: hypothetical protein [unclassified Bradyrhizobium]|uniref:hypothetical protein n=1 Tax=unclassified Bradyrhizobium TaxID=2631580 RepID=UPI001FFA16B1|nr:MULTISPECIES: hypothetical protein [unclassified Bradyrhizobium]MCK1344468.1 hypothetical protein [Bradyrhizobium sp. CW11]MCK1591048.1 hypothetical protein [Bradyrhizobium sp. 169]